MLSVPSLRCGPVVMLESDHPPRSRLHREGDTVRNQKVDHFHSVQESELAMKYNQPLLTHHIHSSWMDGYTQGTDVQCILHIAVHTVHV